MINEQYYLKVREQLNRQHNEEKEKIDKAAEFCSKSIMSNRLIHVFGCGHSQMFAMEIFYRAGGLVPVNSLILPSYSLAPIAKMSTYQERLEDVANKYLEQENVSEKDTMIIVSISGRNAAGIDMALKAKEIGMKVIALTSEKFTNEVDSRHSSGKKLIDVADVVIDIKCDAGDAVLSLDELPEKFTGTSTILGMFAINSITSRTIEKCVENGYNPPIYVSSNLNRGDEINKKHLEKYSGIIRFL